MPVSSMSVNPESSYVAPGWADHRSTSVEISADESRELYRAYIRRLADWVVKDRQGDPRASVMLGTAARNEVKEAETLADLLFKRPEPESVKVEQ